MTAPWPPLGAAAESEAFEPQTAPDQLGVPARSPRRVGPPKRQQRGISFLALAAAATVVVFVLGLAAFDVRMPEWSQASPEGPALSGKADRSSGAALAETPG